MRAALRRCAVAGPPPRRALSSAAAVDDRLLASLEAVCDTSTNASILARHGKDESHHACVPPDVVAFPASTAEVSALLRLCHERRTPVVPFGVGTSLEGHVQAPRGGLSIDVGAKMTAMLEENAGDMDCRAEAGATRKAVNAALRHTGLEFMVDPGADATVGGMAACGASGTTAVRYGTMRDAVLGLTVVLADGTVLETGGRARKSSAGYDLTRLFIGSEGTLGVITEVALALHPAPSHVSARRHERGERARCGIMNPGKISTRSAGADAGAGGLA
ncbi:cytokinin dehydrogenase [Aureococcus anophagefferens]|nr:cytokinin dehydrogenase [Aureococcus anophagefferens]